MGPEIWLIVAICLFLLEAVTFHLVSIWFALGAVITMIASMLGVKDLAWQLIIFVASSGVFLLSTRRALKKYLLRKSEKTNVDSLIGNIAVVCESIDNIQGIGAAKIDGKIWTARSIDDSLIETSALVKVVAIQGVKLMVERATVTQKN